MVTVRRNDPILWLPRGYQPGTDGLLADIQMQEAADLPLLVKLGRAFFQASYYDHLII
jgi:hypothetical protein